MTSQNRHPNTKCNECDVPIYRRPFQLKGPVFCSIKCSNKRNKKEHVCPTCGQIFSRTHSRKKYCSLKCSTDGKIGRPRKEGGDIPLRRLRKELVAIRGGKCEKCGFDDTRILQIHHIVERHNGGTNDPNNLKVLCPNCHCLEHVE